MYEHNTNTVQYNNDTISIQNKIISHIVPKQI